MQDPLRLRRKRIKAGLTQEQLADLAGVGLATISRAEKIGGSPLRVRNLHLIADALGCEVSDLMPVEPTEVAS